MCNQRSFRYGLVAAAALLIGGLAGANAQCFINNQGQMVCPNRPALYGVTRPLQQRVQVQSPTIRYSIVAPRSASYGSTGGYQSVRSAGCNCINCQCDNCPYRTSKDITEQRKAELKELGQLRAYKVGVENQLKALRAENSVLRATQAQPNARRVPTSEPAGVGLPIDLMIPKVSLRLPPSTGLTLPQTLLAVQ
jgi:hypothetical protein